MARPMVEVAGYQGANGTESSLKDRVRLRLKSTSQEGRDGRLGEYIGLATTEAGGLVFHFELRRGRSLHLAYCQVP
jgi:hypothetical protein